MKKVAKPKSDDAIRGRKTRASVPRDALSVAATRTPWLALFLTGLLLCASVMHRFEGVLAKNVELAFFVPMLIGHGGNSGGQAVSTVIRAASKTRGTPHAMRTVLVESISGLLQSIALAALVAPALYFLMGISKPVCAVVAGSLPAIGLFANACGASLPFLALRLGLDPAVVVGPLMTTSVDTVGLSIYLTVASTILSMIEEPQPPPPRWFSGIL